MGHAARVMGAKDEKTPRPHRGQAQLRQAYPVLIGQGFDGNSAVRQPRQKGGVGFMRVKGFHHGMVAEGFLGDQHGLGAAFQLQNGGDIGRSRFFQRDGSFPQGWVGHG